MRKSLTAAVLVAVFAGVLVATAMATLVVSASATAQEEGPRFVLKQGEDGLYVEARGVYLPIDFWFETAEGLEWDFKALWQGFWPLFESQLLRLSDEVVRLGFWDCGEDHNIVALSEDPNWVPDCVPGTKFCGWRRVNDPTPTPTPTATPTPPPTPAPTVPPVEAFQIYLPLVEREH